MLVGDAAQAAALEAAPGAQQQQFLYSTKRLMGRRHAARGCFDVVKLCVQLDVRAASAPATHASAPATHAGLGRWRLSFRAGWLTQCSQTRRDGLPYPDLAVRAGRCCRRCVWRWQGRRAGQALGGWRWG